MTYKLRPAKIEEAPQLCDLIAASMRGLSQQDYTAEQIEGALEGSCSLDTQLIHDGTYFVLESSEGELAGCGGWSFRKTLFGGDAHTVRDAGELDPASEAAKIRAFFIHPNHARKGLALKLLQHCEQAARERGFTRMELMSTMPGLPFYQAQGFIPQEAIDNPLPNGESVRFVPMWKVLD